MTGEAGVIRSADGWSYRLTDDDLLWLARAAKAEGGSSPASTLWTYASRLVARGRGGSMTELVRGHSQPLNPDWSSLSSSGCVRHPEQCSAATLAARERARTAAWEDLSTRPLVVAWAAGRVPNPSPRATDFADETVTSHFLARYPQARLVRRAGNWYVAEGSDSSPRPSVGWPSSFVTVGGAGDAPMSGPWVGPIVGVGIAAVTAAGIGWVLR